MKRNLSKKRDQTPESKKFSLLNKILTIGLFLLIILPPAVLFGEQLDFNLAGLSIFVPDEWNTQKSKNNLTSTSQDGMASIYCAIIEPQKSKESLLDAAKIFTSEIADFSFTGEGKVEQINGLDCFKIEGRGIVNHSKISVYLAFYTTPSQDMIILASVFSDAYGEVYKKILKNIEMSVKETPKR